MAPLRPPSPRNPTVSAGLPAIDKVCRGKLNLPRISTGGLRSRSVPDGVDESLGDSCPAAGGNTDDVRGEVGIALREAVLVEGGEEPVRIRIEDFEWHSDAAVGRRSVLASIASHEQAASALARLVGHRDKPGRRVAALAAEGVHDSIMHLVSIWIATAAS